MEPGRRFGSFRQLAVRYPAYLVGVLLGALVAHDTAAAPPQHRLAIELSPADHRLVGRDRLVWEGPGRLAFRLHPALSPDAVRVADRPYPVEPGDGTGRWRGERPLPAGRHRVTIRYSGRLPPGSEHPGFREVLRGLSPRIGPEGTYLPAGSGWVPAFGHDRITYRLRVTTAGDHKVAAAGTRERTDGPQGRQRTVFRYERPIPGITLLGGPYQAVEGAGDGPVPASALVHPGLGDVATRQLTLAERYLARFQRRLGPYPHPRFDLVSSPWPTGFGFPGLAYIDRRILPLPFIAHSSLPHEILHNWWGNGVYVAEDSGNWAEGLTTFGAEYALAEADSAASARRMRRRWLADFASYHGDRGGQPLRSFGARVDGASRTVGYNKAAFVWIMLRERLGKAAFRKGLRRFYREHRYRDAGWADLRRAFEAVSGSNLAAFFGQWLDRAGGPQPAIAEVDARTHTTRLTLTQKGPAYRLALPVRLTFADGTAAVRTVRLRETRQTFRLATPDRRVARLRVDPDFRVFRRLPREALPPRLSTILAEGEDRTIALAPALASDRARQAARQLGRGLWNAPPSVLTEKTDATRARIRVVPIQTLGAEWADMGGGRTLPSWPEAADARVAVGRRGPGEEDVMVIGVSGPAALAALARPLPHYGSYGWLAFKRGERLDRGRWPVREPSLTWRSPDFSMAPRD